MATADGCPTNDVHVDLLNDNLQGTETLTTNKQIVGGSRRADGKPKSTGVQEGDWAYRDVISAITRRGSP